MDAHNHRVTYDLCYAITFDYEILKKFSSSFIKLVQHPIVNPITRMPNSSIRKMLHMLHLYPSYILPSGSNKIIDFVPTQFVE